MVADSGHGRKVGQDIGEAVSSIPIHTDLPLIGHIDGVQNGHLRGWVTTTSFEQLDVLLTTDTKVVSEGKASLLRSDLRDAKIGAGAHGFLLPLAFRLDSVSEPLWLCARIEGEIQRAFRITLDPNSDSISRLMLDQSLAEAESRIMFVEGNPRDVIGSANRGVAVYFLHTNSKKPQGFQLHLMSAIREAGLSLIVVNSTDEVDGTFCSETRAFADAVIARVNLGRDFGALADFIKLYRASFSGAPLIFVNDSLIGPMFPLEVTLETCAASSADIVGLTESYQNGYHLQSSFLYFK